MDVSGFSAHANETQTDFFFSELAKIANKATLIDDDETETDNKNDDDEEEYFDISDLFKRIDEKNAELEKKKWKIKKMSRIWNQE